MKTSYAKPHVTTPECAPDCFGCRLRTINFSGTCTPNRKPEVVQQNSFVSEMSRDLDAYRRLRAEGLQPKNVKGAADVEQFATSKFEVESFHRLSSAKVGEKYDEAQKFLTSPEGLQPISPPVAD
jgi:hypothetical protein